MRSSLKKSFITLLCVGALTACACNAQDSESIDNSVETSSVSSVEISSLDSFLLQSDSESTAESISEEESFGESSIEESSSEEELSTEEESSSEEEVSSSKEESSQSSSGAIELPEDKFD